MVLTFSGGPGEPGTKTLLDEGHTLQSAVDASVCTPDHADQINGTSKYFDILAFDPRGVLHTTPLLDCFQNVFQRQLWRWQARSEGSLGSSEQAFRDKWAKWKAFGRTCTDIAKNEQAGKIAYHMNTTPVVRDLIEIIETYGQWREREAKKIILGDQGQRWLPTRKQSHLSSAERRVLDRTAWRKGHEKILFWGLSYGTLIGQTFAAMHPNRIERFILDGVSDAEDHFSGLKLSSLQNTDRSFNQLFTDCFKAGPKRCPLWRESEKAIRSTIADRVTLLQNRSLPVPGTRDFGPTSITYADYKELIRSSLYYPISRFPLLARLLDHLLSDNGTEWASYKLGYQEVPTIVQNCTDTPVVESVFPEPPIEPNEESFAGVQCTDFPSIMNETEGDFKSYLGHLRNQSWISGDFWAEMRMKCIDWDIRPAWRYSGLSPMLLYLVTTNSLPC